MEEGSSLAQLPVVRWSRRFRGGTVRLQGHLPATTLAEGLSTVDGEVEVAFTFAGGAQPSVLQLAIVGPLLWAGASVCALDATPDRVLLDGEEVALELRLDRVLEIMVHGLHDTAAWAEVVPDGELLVKFQHGVQAQIAADTVVTLRGRASGPPDALTLCEPMTLSVDGQGLQFTHGRFRRLSTLANLRLEGARLDPDGRVHLHGGASRALDRVVNRGLASASARLSELIRQSPRFAKVRTFLKP